MPIDPQRLRDLADALQGCEWEVPLGSEQLCRDAAEEIEKNRAIALDALAVPPGNETTTYGVLANDKPVLLLASSYKLLREEVRVLSSPQRLAETLSGFVRDQAARAAVKGVK